jgi:hypothetical protein
MDNFSGFLVDVAICFVMDYASSGGGQVTPNFEGVAFVSLGFPFLVTESFPNYQRFDFWRFAFLLSFADCALAGLFVSLRFCHFTTPFWTHRSSISIFILSHQRGSVKFYLA